MRPVPGPGPFPGNPVGEASSGRGEEGTKCLVAVVLVSGIHQGHRALRFGEGGGIGGVQCRIRDREQDLTGATSVSFDGTAAAFTVASASEISTTVPAGATTGKVRVTTPSGPLPGNVAFRVRQ